MPNRYKNTKIHTTKGKRAMKTTILPSIPRAIDDIIIVTKYGDRLDLLAHTHYGKDSYWWIIAEANGLGKGSLHLKPGLQIRIPKDLRQISEKIDKISKGR